MKVKYMDNRLGHSDDVCPESRGRRLPRRPARKSRCPNCKQFIYVRTRPQDSASVLVTESNAAKIDVESDRPDRVESIRRVHGP